MRHEAAQLVSPLAARSVCSHTDGQGRWREAAVPSEQDQIPSIAQRCESAWGVRFDRMHVLEVPVSGR